MPKNKHHEPKPQTMLKRQENNAEKNGACIEGVGGFHRNISLVGAAGRGRPRQAGCGSSGPPATRAWRARSLL